jgi:hypothetical protein
MAFIGTPLDTRNTFQSLAGKRFDGDGSTTAFTLDVAPSSTLDIEVFVGNVRQDPNSAYTLSGTTLTFTGAPPSGTNNIYVVHQAKSVGTIDLPEGALVDLNGGSDKLVLDADGDTTISADTDDQIDFKAGGTDVMSMTATGLTINDGTTITTADNTDTLTLTSTDADANSGPNLRLYRNSSSPADSDKFGQIDFEGRNDNSQDFVAAQIVVNSGDVSDGTEDAQIEFDVMTGGTLREYMRFASGSEPIIIFNEEGQNIDFRVESDNDTHAIYVNAGNDIVNLFNNISSSPNDNTNDEYGMYHDNNGATTFNTNGDAVNVNRQNSDGSVIGIRQEGQGEGDISVSGSTVSYTTFCGAHWSRLADNSKPTILRGTVIESIGTMMDWYNLDIKDENNNTIAKKSIGLPNGKSVGDSHTIVDNGITYTGIISKEDNEQLPKCKISDTADSKAVYGVFMRWDDADDGLDGDVNDMNVAALGAFVIRVHKDQTVSIGDYLVSNGDGTAKKQADDILRASTIAKVTSTTKTHEYADDSYCVPCVLHCG